MNIEELSIDVNCLGPICYVLSWSCASCGCVQSTRVFASLLPDRVVACIGCSRNERYLFEDVLLHLSLYAGMPLASIDSDILSFLGNEAQSLHREMGSNLQFALSALVAHSLLRRGGEGA